ncbi:MAG: hypothetical protein HQ453_11275 [Actinobacteria bacterium]|nr:hypothetical protein [Actinomycetota bacterium]
MSKHEKSIESIAYLPGASADESASGFAPVSTQAESPVVEAQPPLAAEPPFDIEPAAAGSEVETGGDAQARLAALEQQLAEIVADRDDLRRQRDELRDEVLELPEELEAIANSRAFRIMKSGPLLAMRQPLSTLLVISSIGLLTNLWSFTPVATSIYIGVGSVVLLISALQFWASND